MTTISTIEGIDYNEIQQLGRRAFEKGIPRIPYLDISVSENIPILIRIQVWKHWGWGWDKANMEVNKTKGGSNDYN